MQKHRREGPFRRYEGAGLLTFYAARHVGLQKGSEMERACTVRVLPFQNHGSSSITASHVGVLLVQADRLWSAPRPDMRPEQNSQTTYMNRHQNSVHARHLHSDQSLWHGEMLGQSPGTAQPLQQPQLATAGDRAATAQVPGGPPPGTAQPLQQLAAAGYRAAPAQAPGGPPFGTHPDASGAHVESPKPHRASAAVSTTPMHKAGRQSRKSVSPPFATADDPVQPLQSLPEPGFKEISPPYATGKEGVLGYSADSPGKRVQARLILEGNHTDSNVRDRALQLPDRADTLDGAEGLPLVRGEHESAGAPLDAPQADNAAASSPRHSISSIRPYANEASLQARTMHAPKVVMHQSIICRF